MDLEEGMVRKIAISVGAVVVFVGLVVGVATSFSEGGELAPIGGLALVGIIALFVALMGAVGLFLSRTD